jgi:hypothetical protein
MNDQIFNTESDLEKQAEHELIIKKQEIARSEGPQIDHWGGMLFNKLNEIIGDRKISIDKNNIIDQMVTMRLQGFHYEQIIENLIAMYNSYFGQ